MSLSVNPPSTKAGNRAGDTALGGGIGVVAAPVGLFAGTAFIDQAFYTMDDPHKFQASTRFVDAVFDHPWRSFGGAAAVGLAVGAIIGAGLLEQPTMIRR